MVVVSRVGVPLLLNRRQSIAGLVGLLSGASAARAQDVAPSPEFTPHNPKVASDWMDSWMKASRRPVGTLHIARFADPIYFLLKPISWKPDGADASRFPEVTVPAGFVTDFASIPQMFWSALRPDGLYTYPAILHDYLYWTQSHSKDVADNIFNIGMKEFAVPALRRMAIYQSVNLFGGSAWDENARLKAAGERRVLKTSPSDPTIKWAQWKQKPDVFE